MHGGWRFWAVMTAAGGLAALAGCGGAEKQKHEAHAEAPAHWSYEGATGPAHWGSLSPEYALCSTGKSQSPIDIAATAPQDVPNIVFRYEPVAVDIVNNGHTVQVNYAKGSCIEVDGERYDLAQFHFHSPSEHRINGRAADAEMHLVHKSASGRLAVVGVMLVEGPHNAAFEPVWANLPGRAGPAKLTASTIDADALLPGDQRTYRYDGSLTTPPGTEGVRWFLMKEPVALSARQIAAFRQVYHGNNRPVQALNGRVVVEDTSR